jgi:hypothetical protein
MSVQSFGNNILDAKVKTLTSQHDVILSNLDSSGYGHKYTHHINGPNVANPNDYIFNVSEYSATGNTLNDTIMSLTTLATSGTPPFNVTTLTLDANLVAINGLVDIKGAGSGQATLAVGAAPSIEVTGGLQDLTTSSVIMLTQASPNTGGADLTIPLYVQSGVSGNGKFTIYTTSTLVTAVKVNYFVAKF